MTWPLYGVREEVAYKDASHLNSVSQSEKDVSKYIFSPKARLRKRQGAVKTRSSQKEQGEFRHHY